MSLANLVATGIYKIPGNIGTTLATNLANPNVNYKGDMNPIAASVPSAAQLQANHDQGNYVRTGIANGQVLGASTTGAAQTGAAAGNGGDSAVDLSSYDQGIDATNAQMNNLMPNLNNAINGAIGNYQTTINGLNQQKAQTDQTYHQNVVGNQQEWVGNKDLINTNTGNTINSISKVLGARGAAGQSAGDYAALLAAQQGTKQRTGAANTFGHNQQSLDQNYGNYVNGYNQNLDNAGKQRDAEVVNKQVEYKTNRANLLQSLATLVNKRTSAAGGHGVGASQGYANEAQSLLAEAAAMGRPAPVAAQQALTYTPPTLDHYTTNATSVQPGQNAGAATESVTPFLTSLLNRDKQLKTA